MGWAFAMACCAWAQNGTVVLDEPVIRLDDVLEGAPAHLASAVIAEMPDGRGEIELGGEALAALVRRRVPAMRLADAPEAFTFRVEGAESVLRDCLVLRTPVARGEAVNEKDVRTATCAPGVEMGRLRYDAEANAFRAGEALAAGAHIPVVPLTQAGALERGDAATLEIMAGPVKIQRDVRLLQTPRPGGDVFVIGADGKPLAIATDALVGKSGK